MKTAFWQEIDSGQGRGRQLGLVLMGGAMLSQFLIQFSVDGWDCFLPVVCSLPSNGNPLQYSCLENPMDGEAW